MGLIRALAGGARDIFADSWREYFYCESIDKEILMIKGEKRANKTSQNKKGNDNIITNGSIIAVADGQCMIIVDQGKVVEVCAEPGEFVWEASSEPSLLGGNFFQNIGKSFATYGKRITFGGETAKDQRVYYFNIKEIIDNKFGTANAIPFRVLDERIGLDMDTAIRCSGVYSYKITDPLLFYTNVCGNVSEEYRRSEIDSMLKTEFVNGLQIALSELSALGIRPSGIPGHVSELTDSMNKALTSKWSDLRGLTVVSIAMNPIVLPDADAEEIKRIQKLAVNRDPGMAAATLVTSQAAAMEKAAGNESGAMMGFMGMGMAQTAGGVNAQNLFGMQAQQQQAQQQMQQTAAAQAGWACVCGTKNTGKFCANCGTQQPSSKTADEWTCPCGIKNAGKFCANCGSMRPVTSENWTCECGKENSGKFCANCGKQRPAGTKVYACDKCGWTPEDPANPPKFCPECGDPFDENDLK